MNTKNGQQVANIRETKKHPKTSVSYWEGRVYHKMCTRQQGERYAAGEYSVRIAHRRRREAFALGTANKKVAAEKAKGIYLSLLARGWDETLAEFKPAAVSQPKRKERVTVGEFIEVATSLSGARAVTLNAYVTAFRRIVADVSGIGDSARREGLKVWRERVDAVALDRLTPSKVQSWKMAYLKERSGTPEEAAKAIVTSNSRVRNAKSLFSPTILKFVRAQMELPDPLPFDGVTLEKEPSRRYQSKIDAAKLLEAARDELADACPEEYKILLLALFCGLRKSEIDHLPWAAFDFDKAALRIEDTEYHRLKSADSAGSIDLDPELVALFRSLHERGQGEFVVESDNQPRRLMETRTYRLAKHFKSLYAWLKKQGVDARKPLHELRKEFGSLICQRAGIYAASRALRHGDIQITSEVYVDRKEPVTPGLGALLAPNVIEMTPAEANRQNTKLDEDGNTARQQGLARGGAEGF